MIEAVTKMQMRVGVRIPDGVPRCVGFPTRKKNGRRLFIVDSVRNHTLGGHKMRDGVRIKDGVPRSVGFPTRKKRMASVYRRQRPIPFTGET